MFALAGMVGAVVATPIAVYASHRFTDVPGSNTFHADIEWLKDNGITFGCNPPANTKYCPDDFVTRGQMAAFMKRLAENKVVDAATAVNADTATNATNADDADKLDGLSSSAYMTKTVYDSDKDGIVDLLPRAAFNSVGSAPDGADFTLSTEITAPAPGILLLSGGVDALDDTAITNYTCTLEIDDATVKGTIMVSRIDGGTGFNTGEDCTTSGAVLVDAGTYTIDFEVELVAATTGHNDASMWVLWVPLDGTGAVPIP